MSTWHLKRDEITAAVAKWHLPLAFVRTRPEASFPLRDVCLHYKAIPSIFKRATHNRQSHQDKNPRTMIKSTQLVKHHPTNHRIDIVFTLCTHVGNETRKMCMTSQWWPAPAAAAAAAAAATEGVINAHRLAPVLGTNNRLTNTLTRIIRSWTQPYKSQTVTVRNHTWQLCNAAVVIL